MRNLPSRVAVRIQVSPTVDVVVDTPFYGLTGADGKARIATVTPGNYRLRVWHPGLPGTTDGVVSAITVGSGDIDQTVQLKVSDNPLAPRL